MSKKKNKEAEEIFEFSGTVEEASSEDVEEINDKEVFEKSKDEIPEVTPETDESEKSDSRIEDGPVKEEAPEVFLGSEPVDKVEEGDMVGIARITPAKFSGLVGEVLSVRKGSLELITKEGTVIVPTTKCLKV